MRVCLVSSGTGGHLWPAVVLAEALVEAGHETMLVTEGRVVERELLDRMRARAPSLEASSLEVVPLGATRAGGVGQWIGLLRSTWRARRLLRARGVDVVVGTGGRTSVPVGWAARSLGVPLFLLEQNAVAGRANRLLMPMARRVYMGLPPTRDLRRSVVTGTPLRREFAAVDRRLARSGLGLDEDSPVVLVTGGSQGAQVLNELVPDALCALRRPLQVVHLSGSGRDEDVRRRYAAGLDHGLHAVVRAMALDMANLYAASDLVLCRGGGCTVAELMAIGRPAIIVPYPHHRDRQQLHNGRVLERVGAARVIEQADLSVGVLCESIGELLNDPDRLVEMGSRARQLAPGEPCNRILNDMGARMAAG